MAKRKSSNPVLTLEPMEACIYCGRSDVPLQLEHIFPYALGGTCELPDASCDECAERINREIENPINNTEWGNLREKFGLPSRGKTKRTHVNARRKDGGSIKIPIADYPVLSPVYNFGTARLLRGMEAKQPNNLVICAPDCDTSDPACKVKYPEWDGVYAIKFRGPTFARLIAKIAWGFVVAQQGSAWFRETITPIILGDVDDPSTHVGGSLQGYIWRGAEEGLPQVHVRTVSETKGLVICDIAFMESPKWPRYHVVLGELDLEFDRVSNHIKMGRIQSPAFSPGVSIERPIPARNMFMAVGQELELPPE